MTLTIYYQPWTDTVQLMSAVSATPVTETNMIIGGYTSQPVDTNDQSLQSVLSAALSTYNSGNSVGGPWTVDQVVSVATQVVAGVNYQVEVILINAQKQQSEVTWVVFSQPWTNTYKLVSSTPTSTTELRALQMGGWTPQPVDMNDPAIQTAMDCAMTTLGSGNGLLSSELWTVSKVVSVQTQIVAGINYQILAEVTNSGGQSMYMLWTVNEEPWNNKYTLTSYQVEQENMRNLQNLGGWTTQSPSTNDAGVGIAVQTFIASETQENGLLGAGDWEVSKILSVQTQIVAGTNYNIEAELTNTENGDTMTVQFVVFEQPWTSTNTLTSSQVISSSA